MTFQSWLASIQAQRTGAARVVAAERFEGVVALLGFDGAHASIDPRAVDAARTLVRVEVVPDIAADSAHARCARVELRARADVLAPVFLIAPRRRELVDDRVIGPLRIGEAHLWIGRSGDGRPLCSATTANDDSTR
jgi:hypothetical protein